MHHKFKIMNWILLILFDYFFWLDILSDLVLFFFGECKWGITKCWKSNTNSNFEYIIRLISRFLIEGFRNFNRISYRPTLDKSYSDTKWEREKDFFLSRCWKFLVLLNKKTISRRETREIWMNFEYWLLLLSHKPDPKWIVDSSSIYSHK